MTNSNLDNWTASGSWGLSTEIFVSAFSSFTDSPNDVYAPDTESFLRLNTPIDLSTAEAAYVLFEARWEIENNYDFVQIMVRTGAIRDAKTIMLLQYAILNGIL